MIKLYDGKEYSLEEIKELVEQAHLCEMSFDEAAGDGDLSTSNYVIAGLLELIDSKYKINLPE